MFLNMIIIDISKQLDICFHWLNLPSYLHEFIVLFNHGMEKLVSQDKEIFLMGDFNMHRIKVDIDISTTNFLDIITST